ncbi:restriction endonuclease subunit S [Tolypothrix sp. VBCCA 56010]|uniref:restriction endonuclease subunit S n=1 Tax=Tolypothrix sp. VBCCA 56010 TaxID=3137731 RepID=UPI003D7ED48B
MTASIHELIRLKYIASVEMGQSPPSAEYSLSADAGLPFLQGTADFGTLHPLPRIYCPVSTKLAIPEDILFSVRAPVGELNIADRKYGIGRGLCAIRCLHHLHKGFAWWALHLARTQLAYETTGSTYEAVTSEDVANLLILFPSLDNQKAIANYLDRETAKIDTLISAKERLLDLLTEKRRALITHAVTRGLNPDVSLQDSSFEFFNYIPEHWEVINLKFLGKVKTGVTKGRNFGNRETVLVPYLRVANVQDGYLDLSDIAQIEVLPEEISSKNKAGYVPTQVCVLMAT